VSRSSGRPAGGPTGWPAEGHGGHVVQFYPAEEELAVQVARYLAEGVKAGNGVLVVATLAHRQAFAASLAAEGVDAGREQQAGRLLVADASGLLGSFLDGGRLDRDKFTAVAAGLIGRAAAGGRPIRIYAEMVALLWDAGDVALAIELEGLWNELGARLPFSLRCGYPARVLAGPDSAGAVRDVCRLHAAVADQRSFPAELNSVRSARHYVTGLLGRRAGEPVDDALAQDAAIVVTELAANAVLHARSAFTLTVSRSAAGVRIAVRDNTPVAATSDAATSNGAPFTARAGHGLSVVAQIASSWSVEQLADGKVAWAELLADRAIR
jgi:anti-sigma regulatory factor (Ser/Thr protein kinase)